MKLCERVFDLDGLILTSCPFVFIQQGHCNVPYVSNDMHTTLQLLELFVSYIISRPHESPEIKATGQVG